MNLIQNTILTALPANKKKTPSGWISFNAPSGGAGKGGWVGGGNGFGGENVA